MGQRLRLKNVKVTKNSLIFFFLLLKQTCFFYVLTFVPLISVIVNVWLRGCAVEGLMTDVTDVRISHMHFSRKGGHCPRISKIN